MALHTWGWELNPRYNPPENEMEELYDVVAINIETSARRFIARGKTLRNAEAIENMVIMRCGVDEEFYEIAPHIGEGM